MNLDQIRNATNDFLAPIELERPIVDPVAFEIPPGEHLIRDAAQIFFESLREYLQSVESGLRDDQRLALIHTQTGEVIVISTIAFANPSAIIVEGHDVSQSPSVVYAHLNSFQMLFKTIDAPEDEDEPRQPIGFQMPSAKTN